jgi:uncharacterized protein YhhL (DUF1145 family)
MTSSKKKSSVGVSIQFYWDFLSLQTLFAFPLQNPAYYFNLLYLIFSKLVKLSKLDVRGSVHHSTIREEKSNKMQQRIKILLFHII